MAEGRCKKAALKNCGPLRDGDDYCLFHKPYKGKGEARSFYEKLKAQAIEKTDRFGNSKLVFKDKVDWCGYVFPKDDEGLAIFEGASFERIAIFEGTTFESKADFCDATFKDLVFFGGATFKGRAEFSDATFEGEASFSDKATFEGKASFSDATFKAWAEFNCVRFKGEATFSGTIFEGEASFRDATFERLATFGGSTFEGRASFSDSTFIGLVFFGGVTFKGRAVFSGSSCVGNASFLGALFERTCTFANRNFGGKLLFTNTEFRQGIQIERDWESPEPKKYKLAQAEQEGCRVQKISYENEGRKEAAEAMFVREMRARRREKIVSEKKPLLKYPGRYIFYWLEKWAIDKTCKYGTDWYSLFKATLLVIISFSLIYFLSYYDIWFLGNLGQSSFYSFNIEWSWALLSELCDAFLQSIYFSIVAFTTLGSGSLNPEGLMRFIVGAQSLIGAFFIALFVVVFARKWMR